MSLKRLLKVTICLSLVRVLYKAGNGKKMLVYIFCVNRSLMAEAMKKWVQYLPDTEG